MITSEIAQILDSGIPVQRWTLQNKNGLRATFLTLGAVLESFWTPDRGGTLGNIVLNWPEPQDYGDNPACVGALVGRTAGRTQGAVLPIGDDRWHITRNNGQNSIHGGLPGFHRVHWHALAQEDTLVMTYHSPDGEGGYPGAVDFSVRFTLTEDNRLIQDYEATVSRKTWVNPTNHSYFNLSAGIDADICRHDLYISSTAYAPVGTDGLPVSGWALSAGTPFDFTSGCNLGEGLSQNHPQLLRCKGYDHPLRLESRQAPIRLQHPPSGRGLEIHTDRPAVVLYTGNYLHEAVDHQGTPRFCRHQGVCLETQEVPNAVNDPAFEMVWAVPETRWRSRTVFSAVLCR